MQLQPHYISYQVNREKCSKTQWNISDLADLCSTRYIIFLKLCLCQHFLKPTHTDITDNANYFYILSHDSSFKSCPRQWRNVPMTKDFRLEKVTALGIALTTGSPVWCHSLSLVPHSWCMELKFSKSYTLLMLCSCIFPAKHQGKTTCIFDSTC